MSIVKFAKFRSKEEIDAAIDNYSFIKDNYIDRRSHFDQTKGKWIGALFSPFAIATPLGHLYDRKKRREEFIGPEGAEKFILKR